MSSVLNVNHSIVRIAFRRFHLNHIDTAKKELLEVRRRMGERDAFKFNISPMFRLNFVSVDLSAI